jgi:hypothetical protein
VTLLPRAAGRRYSPTHRTLNSKSAANALEAAKVVLKQMESRFC